MVALDAVRSTAGITQTQLAETLGMTQGAVSKLMRKDDMMISTLAKCLQALDATAELVIRVGDEVITMSVVEKES